MRSFVVFLLMLVFGACGGGGSSPTGPPPPSAPAPNPTPSPSPTSTPAPLPTPSPAPSPPPGPIVLRRASITGANGHAAGGTAEIVRSGSSFTLELLDDFRIDSGNNDVYLANQADRVTGADLNLGDMRSRAGAQSYALPNDGASYRYVLLWCRPFRVPIGLGELR